MPESLPQLLAQTLPAIRPTFAFFSVALIFFTLVEGFESLVLPRRIERRFRFTRIFYVKTWRLWRAIGKRLPDRTRDNYLSVYGPLSLLLLLTVWALCLVVGFATLFWSIALPVHATASDTVITYDTYLYFSGTTFITLGYGDISPSGALGRALSNVEAGIGFGFLAIIIGYLPVLYGAFAKRESRIALLDARASSPPSAGELLRRHKNNAAELTTLLREWEMWSAELLESHLSYPVLAYYRSQHEQQSWLNSLTVILDTCAYVIASTDDERNALLWQARLTFAMARHAAVDIAIIFSIEPRRLMLSRLTESEINQLIENLADGELPLPTRAEQRTRIQELRGFYEPYVYVLSKLLAMPLPGWITDVNQLDNWKTSSWDRDDHFFYNSTN